MQKVLFLFVFLFVLSGCSPLFDKEAYQETWKGSNDIVHDLTPSPLSEQSPPSLQDTLIESSPGQLPEATATLRTCSTNAQCAVVRGDCCGCSSGGTATSLNKEYVENWEDTLESKCATAKCKTVLSSDWTCQIQPTCIKNKCTLQKPTS